MPHSSNFYNLTYSNFANPILAEIRQETFGEDIGQNSWLTADEYRQFIGWLKLNSSSQVLDIGSGSGGLSGTYRRLPYNRLRHQPEQYGCCKRVGKNAWT